MHFDPNQFQFLLFDARERDDNHIIKLKEFVGVIEPTAEYTDDGNANLEHRAISIKDPTIDDVETPIDTTAPPEPSPDEVDQPSTGKYGEIGPPEETTTRNENATNFDVQTIPIPKDGMPLPWPRKVIRRTDYRRPDSWDPDK